MTETVCHWSDAGPQWHKRKMPSPKIKIIKNETTKNKKITMEVTTFCINKGRKSMYFGLKNKKENQVLYSAPNNWKTEKGALQWAVNHGYTIPASKKKLLSKNKTTSKIVRKKK